MCGFRNNPTVNYNDIYREKRKNEAFLQYYLVNELMIDE